MGLQDGVAARGAPAGVDGLDPARLESQGRARRRLGRAVLRGPHLLRRRLAPTRATRGGGGGGGVAPLAPRALLLLARLRRRRAREREGVERRLGGPEERGVGAERLQHAPVGQGQPLARPERLVHDELVAALRHRVGHVLGPHLLRLGARLRARLGARLRVGVRVGRWG